ncbi:glycosyltransferase family 4 protein, partial [Patescibacteria group bacterium]|nr:glycosyltransferase family 4 protein [Patescibacteria group bacterium]
DELARIDRKNRYLLLLRKKYFKKLKLPDNWKKVLADFRHYGILEQTKLPQLIRQKEPDLVHFPHFNVPIFYRGRYVVTIHDLTMHRQGRAASTLPLPAYLVKRLFYKYLFRHAVTNSSKIITPTKAVKREIKNYFRLADEKISVIHEGISERFRVADASEARILKKYKLKVQNYFIYLGNVYPHKNISRAIEAVIELNRDRKDKVLLAISSSRNVFTKRLEKIIRACNAEAYVKLLGFVEDAELNVLLKNSIGLVYPSLSEGFGLPGLEAISSGTLLLASDIPVFKEVYKGNAIYFNPYDFTTIQKAMSDAMNMDNKEREKIIKNGQKFIKRYSWAKMAKQTLKLYEDSAGL